VHIVYMHFINSMLHLGCDDNKANSHIVSMSDIIGFRIIIMVPILTMSDTLIKKYYV
jgi:hypothetical protein